MKLKVGDSVRSILPPHRGYLTVGKIYKIIKIKNYEYQEFFIIDDKGNEDGWGFPNSYFELIEPFKDEEGDVHEDKPTRGYQCGNTKDAKAQIYDGKKWVEPCKHKQIPALCKECIEEDLEDLREKGLCEHQNINGECDECEKSSSLFSAGWPKCKKCNQYFNIPSHEENVCRVCSKEFPLEESLKSAGMSLHIGTPKIKQCGCAYYPECDLIFKCSECTDKPLKAEDLKVGMVFEDKEIYYKLLFYYLDYFFVARNHKFYEPQLKSDSIHKDYFIKHCRLIDKVPPKIVEVEEEVEVFCPVYDLSEYSVKPYIQAFKRTPNGIPADKEKEFELCKIKRKFEKELNWDWEMGQWK